VTNAPVALIFFNRPETLKLVFESIKKVKPNKLFLIQDGPRNNSDIEKINQCRNIVEEIDWECDVKKNYAEKNLGCGLRPSSGISWAFEQTDKLIILEDDCIADKSFFIYCDELLEKYKNDERICYISGLNHFETWDCGESSYCFTKSGAIWGWATWKRAWDMYDYFAGLVKDKFFIRKLKFHFNSVVAFEKRINAWERAYNSKLNGEKLSYWDYQWGLVKYTQGSLVIVPKVNLIRNIGVGDQSTHAKSMKLKFVRFKNFIDIPVHELKLPLKHPSHCLCDLEYDALVSKCSDTKLYLRKLRNLIKIIVNK